MMIGAPDHGSARMNNFSFWLLPAAFGLLRLGRCSWKEVPKLGWTFYAPLSTTYAPPSVTFFIFGHSPGEVISSIMGAIQYHRDHPNLRARGISTLE